MKFIAHRGNTLKSNPDRENTIEYIDEAICQGYDCEVDVREYYNGIYLGHDFCQEEISVEWLLDRAHNLFIHCKNLESLEMLSNHEFSYLLNYFFHDGDDATLTSQNDIWIHPKSKYLPQDSIFVMSPQEGLWNFTVKDIFDKCMGICTDHPEQYRSIFQDYTS